MLTVSINSIYKLRKFLCIPSLVNIFIMGRFCQMFLLDWDDHSFFLSSINRLYPPSIYLSSVYLSSIYFNWGLNSGPCAGTLHLTPTPRPHMACYSDWIFWFTPRISPTWLWSIIIFIWSVLFNLLELPLMGSFSSSKQALCGGWCLRS
jgi:hypothetical protein